MTLRTEPSGALLGLIAVPILAISHWHPPRGGRSGPTPCKHGCARNAPARTLKRAATPVHALTPMRLLRRKRPPDPGANEASLGRPLRRAALPFACLSGAGR